MTLKMAVPNKGRLNERTVDLLIKSGLDLGDDWGRKLYVKVNNKDIEVIFVRAQDIPIFVNAGAVDIGITGQDQIYNSGLDVEEVLLLGFGHCRLSVAAPETCGIKSLDDIPEGSRIATSFVNISKKYFESINKNVEIVQVTGAAEIMPHMGVSDLIIDLVSSGSTLKTNHLVEIHTILKSEAVMLANRSSLKEKKSEIDGIKNAFYSVMSAEGKKYLMANIPRSKLEDIMRMLPGLEGPTVMDIAGNPDLVSIHVVVDNNKIYDAINMLREFNGRGILTIPLERVVE